MSLISRIAQPLVNAIYYGSRGFKTQVRTLKLSKRSFDSGIIDRITNSFKGTSLSVNESLKQNLDKMRERSRELVNDNDYGKKYITMVKTNVVGYRGIKLQARAKDSRGMPDKLDNDAIEKAWRDFCNKNNCSVNGMVSMLDIQNISIAAVASDGESIIRIVRGSKYKYGISLQLIEADRLDTKLNREVLGSRNRISMGIEYDAFDTPVAYYFLSQHPGESIVRHGQKQYFKVPASDIIHLFRPERVSQERGIPWMHSAIRRIQQVGAYEEAEVIAARIGASKMGFYYTDTGTEYKGDDTDTDGSIIQEAVPGAFEQLPNNVRVETFDPQHPTGAYNYFLRGVLKGVAAGLGVSYTGFTGDLEAVNYSSIRAGLIDERENWRSIQGWFIEHCMDKLYQQWLSAALTRGLIINESGVRLPLSKKDKFLDVKWQPRGWAWVDPLKDQQANELAVSKGHTTNSAVVAAQGNDLEEIYETLRYEKELANKYGLTFDNGGTDNAAEQDEDGFSKV